MKATDIIPHDLITAARAAGACITAMEWIDAAPRTWQDLVDRRIDWLIWAVRWLYFRAIPDGLYVPGDMDLSRCASLTALPDGLYVPGCLDLSDCTSLVAIPDGLHVEGCLYLHRCTSLTAIPDGLYVRGDLDLRGCTALAIIPDTIRVGGRIYR